MLKNKGQDISIALKNRYKDGYRFDNSKYWKEYYVQKLKGSNLGREKRYANFLTSLVGKNSEVLDVATGYGFLPLEMIKLGLNVTCCDVFEDMIKTAKKYFKDNGYSIKIVKSDVINLPFGKDSFKLLTAVSILEHLTLSESSKFFIPSLRKIVKKGGYVLIHVPVKSVVTRFKKFYRIFIKRDVPRWAIDDDGDVTHKIWFSAEDYFDILLNFGLNPKYITFNFVRSNEKLIWIKFLNALMSLFDGKFYKIENGQMNLFQKFMAKFAVSCAFVCKN